MTYSKRDDEVPEYLECESCGEIYRTPQTPLQHGNLCWPCLEEAIDKENLLFAKETLGRAIINKMSGDPVKAMRLLSVLYTELTDSLTEDQMHNLAKYITDVNLDY